ncbi:MAG: hypothetical protein JWN70_1634, partial [Planctomycetaceae bacterium]|nr:hypothetical protein [Planctomycetaceae bacterium]
FSSHNQCESSVDDQLRQTRELLESLGYRLPCRFEYSDHAVSGTKLSREGLNQFLIDAKARKFKVLGLYSLSRLGRESIITMPMLKVLVEEYGIRIVSVAESFDTNSPDWIMVAMMYTLQHENFVKELSKNVLRGQEGALLDEYSVGDYRFGYRSVPSADGAMRGRGRNAKPRMDYQIDPEQAAWVKQIFEWYVKDLRTISWITEQLKLRNAPRDHRATTPHWKPQQVAGLLSSRKYVGVWPWGVKRNKRLPSTGQIIQVTRPESESSKWTRKRPDLRLISDEMFEAAQARRQKHIEQAAKRRGDQGRLGGRVTESNTQHLLAGLFQCQSCSRLFHTAGAKANYMSCSGYKYKICNCRTMVPRALAEKLILDAVGSVIQSNTEWLQQIIAFTKEEITRAAREQPSQLVSVTQQLGSVNQKIERLLNLAETTDDSSIQTRLSQRQRERESLQRQLQQLQRDQRQIPQMPTEEWVVEQITQLDQVLTSATPAATHALHQLLDGPIIMEQIPHADSEKCHFRGRMRVRIGRMIVDPGSHIPGVMTAQSGEADIVHEVLIEFREPTKTEEQAALAWELYSAERPIKEIAKMLNVSRARMTAILKFAAAERGEPWLDGRARRATLPDSTRPLTLRDQKAPEILDLYQRGLLLGDIAERLDIDRATVQVVLAKWHEQQGLRLLDGRTRRKNLEVKVSPHQAEAALPELQDPLADTPLD